MAQIVHTGAVSAPVVGDAGSPQKPAEVPLDVAEREGLAGSAGEEPFPPARLPGGLGVVAGEPGA